MYECIFCNFSTDRLPDLNRHYNTKKHIRNEYLNSLKNETSYDHFNGGVKKHTNSVKSTHEKLDEKLQTCQQIENFCKNTEKNDTENLSKYTDESQIINKTSSDSKNFDTNNSQVVILTSTKYKSKIRECECGKICNSRQALWFHKQTCTGEKPIVKEEKLTYTKSEINEMINIAVEKRMMQSKTQNINGDHNMTNSISNSNNTIDNSINTQNNQKIVNVINYVNSHYHNTPNIKILSPNEIDKLLMVDENIKHSIEELLVFNQSKFILDRFLGEIIIKAYKTEDPEDQQFWTSNIKKLTFIVRQLLNKKEKKWLTDQNGTCLTNHIINPLLKTIKKLLQNHSQKLNDKREKLLKKIDELSTDDYERCIAMTSVDKLNANGMDAIKIIYSINDTTLHKQILKYIAPHFQLEQSNLITEIKLQKNETQLVEIEKKPKKKTQISATKN